MALCKLCTPPQTSIVPDTRQTGYEAAGILDRMMPGEKVEGAAKRMAPLRVHERLSTDTVAVDVSDVRIALQFVQQNATTGINVLDVMRERAISRRVLESRFQQVIGHTPHREIERVRIKRVKRLPIDTTLSIEAIAYRTGFSHPDYLSVAFKRATALTPGEYQQQNASQ